MPTDNRLLLAANRALKDTGCDAVLVIALSHGERTSRHAAFGAGAEGRRLADALVEALARAMDRERELMAMEEAEAREAA